MLSSVRSGGCNIGNRKRLTLSKYEWDKSGVLFNSGISSLPLVPRFSFTWVGGEKGQNSFSQSLLFWFITLFWKEELFRSVGSKFWGLLALVGFENGQRFWNFAEMCAGRYGVCSPFCGRAATLANVGYSIVLMLGGRCIETGMPWMFGSIR